MQTSPSNPLIDNGRAIENKPNPRRRASAGVVRPMTVNELARNGLDLSCDVIYAQDLPDSIQMLSVIFPKGRIYRYDRPDDQPHGTLTLLR